jgi:hypothetical protein
MSIQYQLQRVDQISSATYFVCKMVKPAGLKEENIKFFKSSTTGIRWRVDTACFISAKQAKKGIRIYGVTPLEPGCIANAGDILIGESS